MENQAVENTSENKLVIPYDKDRKNLTFYDTCVDMNGDVVKYDDIAVFQSAAFNNSSMIYIYFSKSFNYNFTLTTYDGNKHVFKRSGYSAYGIGTYKRIYNEYSEVAAPFYDIVLPKVANRLISRIAEGAKANISGLEITKDRLTCVRKKETIVIDRSNFDRAVINSGMTSIAQIYIRDEKKPVFYANLNEPNARLIVPIVNYFFEYKPENRGPAAQ